MTLGECIKAQRKRCGFSQEKVAELVGVSRQAVTKWETGQSAPSTENLLKLAEIFGVELNGLLPALQEEQETAACNCDRCRIERAVENDARRTARKRNLAGALLIVGAYLVLYLLGRVIWCDLSESSFMGWLLSVRPAGAHSYLYGWLLSSRLFWAAMLLSALPALLGKFRFSYITLAGFVIGFLAGMVFGPNPGGAAMGQSHYGWAIWAAVYLLSVVVGILAERLAGRAGSKT